MAEEKSTIITLIMLSKMHDEEMSKKTSASYSRATAWNSWKLSVELRARGEKRRILLESRSSVIPLKLLNDPWQQEEGGEKIIETSINTT
jgi:hypothetical protein